MPSGRNHGTSDMLSPALTTITSSPSNHVTSPNSHVTSLHQYQMTSSQHQVSSSPAHSAEYESPIQNRSSTLGRNNNSVLPHKSYQVWKIYLILNLVLIFCIIYSYDSNYLTLRTFFYLNLKQAIQSFNSWRSRISKTEMVAFSKLCLYKNEPSFETNELEYFSICQISWTNGGSKSYQKELF